MRISEHLLHTVVSNISGSSEHVVAEELGEGMHDVRVANPRFILSESQNPDTPGVTRSAGIRMFLARIIETRARVRSLNIQDTPALVIPLSNNSFKNPVLHTKKSRQPVSEDSTHMIVTGASLPVALWNEYLRDELDCIDSYIAYHDMEGSLAGVRLERVADARRACGYLLSDVKKIQNDPDLLRVVRRLVKESGYGQYVTARDVNDSLAETGIVMYQEDRNVFSARNIMWALTSEGIVASGILPPPHRR